MLIWGPAVAFILWMGVVWRVKTGTSAIGAESAGFRTSLGFGLLTVAIAAYRLVDLKRKGTPIESWLIVSVGLLFIIGFVGLAMLARLDESD